MEGSRFPLLRLLGCILTGRNRSYLLISYHIQMNELALFTAGHFLLSRRDRQSASLSIIWLTNQTPNRR